MENAAITPNPQDATSASLIQVFLDEFASEDIDYCVLRGYEHLPYTLGHDIDILVSPLCIGRAIAIIRAAAERQEWLHVGTARRYGYNGIHLFKNDAHLQIDLLTECHWRGIAYVKASQVLQAKTNFRDYRVASHGCESAITLMKELLPWGEVKRKDNARDRLQQCAKTDSEGFLLCLKPCLGGQMSRRVLEWTKNGHWDKIEARVSSIRRAMVRRSFFPNLVRRFLKFLQFAWGPIQHRIRRPFGCFVVILGPDGSGKTTVANEVMSYWEKEFHKKPLYIHGNFAVLPRLRILRRIWATLRGRELPPDPDYTLKHSGAQAVPHSVGKSLCYLAYYYWGYVLGHFRIFLAQGQDRLIVADRYFYDYFFQRGNMHLPHWLLRMLSRFIPRADLVVLLEADPQAIYDRKKELTVEEIGRQQSIIRKMAGWLPNVLRVRSDIGIDTTVRESRKAIFTAMAKRHR